MAYFVDTTFTLKDNTDRAFKNLIGNLDTAQKSLGSFIDLLTKSEMKIGGLGVVIKELNSPFEQMNRNVTSSSGRFNTLIDKTSVATTNMERLRNETLKTGESFTMLARQMGSVKFLGAGGGRGGGAGKGEGFGGNFMAGALMGINPALGMAALGRAGLGLGAGMGVVEMIKNANEASNELQQEMDRMRGSGNFTEAQVLQAKQMAFSTARNTLLATPGSVLRSINEVAGMGTISTPEAIKLAPEFAQAELAFRLMSRDKPSMHGQETTLAKTLIQVVEKSGVTDAKERKRYMDDLIKMFYLRGGTVTPQQLSTALTFARGGRYGLSEHALFADMSFFLAEQGGKGGRTGPVGTYFNQLSRLRRGMATKPLLSHWQKIGLLPEKDDQGRPIELKTATLKSMVSQKFLKQGDLFQADPNLWTMTVGLPAELKQQFPKLKTDEERFAAFNKLDRAKRAGIVSQFAPGATGGQLDVFTQFALDWKAMKAGRERFDRIDVEAIKRRAANNQVMKQEDLGAKWNLMMAEIGDSKSFKTLQHGLVDVLGGGLNHLVRWFDKTDVALENLNKAFEPTFKSAAELTKMIGMLGHAISNFFQGPAAGSVAANLWGGFEKIDPEMAWLVGSAGKIGNSAAKGIGDWLDPSGIRPAAPAGAVGIGHPEGRMFGSPASQSLVPPPPATAPSLVGSPNVVLNQTFNGQHDPQKVKQASHQGIVEGIAQFLAKQAKIFNATSGSGSQSPSVDAAK